MSAVYRELIFSMDSSSEGRVLNRAAAFVDSIYGFLPLRRQSILAFRGDTCASKHFTLVQKMFSMKIYTQILYVQKTFYTVNIFCMLIFLVCNILCTLKKLIRMKTCMKNLLGAYQKNLLCTMCCWYKQMCCTYCRKLLYEKNSCTLRTKSFYVQNFSGTTCKLFCT